MLGEAAPIPRLEAEVEREAAALARDFERERTLLLFSGEYDAGARS